MPKELPTIGNSLLTGVNIWEIEHFGAISHEKTMKTVV